MATPDQQLQNRARFHEMYIKSVDEEIALEHTNNDNGFWKRARLFTRNIASRYTQYTHPLALYEWDLHELWYLFLRAATITDADNAAQDRLASQILHTREMGTLSRLLPSDDPGDNGKGKVETAMTSDGEIWRDLPFLAQDVQKAWKESVGLSRVQRHNLSAFVARLAGYGVRDPELCSCSIWILRDALETPRLLVSEGDSGEQQEPSIAELLPAAMAWFQYAGHKLESLSIANYAPADSDVGELAHRAGVRPINGFSTARWLFWRARFEELSRCEEKEIADVATRAFRLMMSWGERIASLSNVDKEGVDLSIEVS